MKIHIALALLVSTSIAMAGPLAVEPEWMPMYGATNSTSKLYVDQKTRSTVISPSQETINAVTILVVPATPITIMVQGDPVVTQSLASRIVVNCTTHLLVPIVDIYYSVSMPALKDEPVAMKMYSVSRSAMHLPRSSPIYSIACPEYI